MPIPEEITVREDGSLDIKSPISLLKPEHVSFLLCYYPQLKAECCDDLMGDMHWLLIDLEDLATKALEDEPVLMDLIT